MTPRLGSKDPNERKPAPVPRDDPGLLARKDETPKTKLEDIDAKFRALMAKAHPGRVTVPAPLDDHVIRHVRPSEF